MRSHEEPPITAELLTMDLVELGVQPGDTVLVHSSLRAIRGSYSLLVGGPLAVIEALRRAVAETGNVVMPTHSPDLHDPESWRDPTIPPAYWEPFRRHWPPFRPDATPSRYVGVVPEVFRAIEGVVRSGHPHFSFAAAGPDARLITSPHALEHGLDDESPLGRLCSADARVLLLGSPWSRCTGFHLAEARAFPTLLEDRGAPILRDGRRVWARFRNHAVRSDDFDALGAAFEATGDVTLGFVGRALARAFSLRAAVEFARPWLEAHRER